MIRQLALVAMLTACGSDDGGNEPGPLPSTDTLCKLTIGYENDRPDPLSPGVLGTNADDVRGVLGAPTEASDTRLKYVWQGARTTSATFSLKRKDLCYRESGKPITPPYWLSGVTVEGFDRPKCWVMGSEVAGNCPECLDEQDVGMCK